MKRRAYPGSYGKRRERKKAEAITADTVARYWKKQHNKRRKHAVAVALQMMKQRRRYLGKPIKLGE